MFWYIPTSTVVGFITGTKFDRHRTGDGDDF